MEQAPLSLTKKFQVLMIVATVAFLSPLGTAGQSTPPSEPPAGLFYGCDGADDLECVEVGGRRVVKI